MNKVFLTIVSIAIAVSLSGCFSTRKVTYIHYKDYPQQTEKNLSHVNKKVFTKEDISGIIKGKIQKIFYDSSKALWHYEVKSADTSNGKLAFAKFTLEQNIAKIGDLIYVFIKNGKLEKFYLLKKASFIKKSKTKKRKIIIHKRSKHIKSPINVPISEALSFD